jgi:hypothetical protein
VLSFQHYVATEVGFDGGNVEISVNGDAFSRIPTSAFTFNGPNTTLQSAAAGNTNPMAGEPAWSGTDGGEVNGSWGETQIDLTAAGVSTGDLIQLKFDSGRDGCSGVDGWYVDDIQVLTCKSKANVSADRPSATAYGRSPRVHVVVDSAADYGDPTGSVVASFRGNEIGEAMLRGGAATMNLSPGLPVGTHDVVVRYFGDDLHDGSADTVAVRIVKGATRATLDVQPSPVVQGRRVFADVDVNGSGFSPTGRVVLAKGRQVVASGVLDDGGKRFVLDADWKPGHYTFTVKYLGNGNTSASSDSDPLRVAKR